MGLWSFFDNIGVKSVKIIHRGPPKKFKDIPLYLRVILNEKYFRAFSHSNLLGSLEVSPENYDMAPLNSSLTLNALKGLCRLRNSEQGLLLSPLKSVFSAPKHLVTFYRWLSDLSGSVSGPI